MTFSIVARDPATGDVGIAVASRFFAVGAVVPHVRHNSAVATQAYVNPMWGIEGVARLANREPAEAVLSDFVARDPGQHERQAHMIDADGRSAGHTGAGCVDWAGHTLAEGVSVAGNMLAGPEVVARTLECYLDNPGIELAERLLVAMEAGEAAGGDKRGRQSASLRTHRRQDYPHYDLRVDDHADPLAELRRLKAVAEERYIIFAETFGTSDRFAGTVERAGVDQALAEKEADMARRGVPSLSHASLPKT